MRLLDITATANPAGNRIDLAWTFPERPDFPGVRVVRRAGTHPETPGDGVLVAEGVGLTGASDDPVPGERVQYYTLFPFTGDPPDFDDLDAHNRVAAMATSPYGFAARLYDLLPAIYRRFDADRPNGQLRRFLELPGGELDRLHSLVRAALDLTDVDLLDGTLLPLLAQWIGWPTNFGLPVDRQRTEIRFAPRLFHGVGAVPTLDATVARVSGWSSPTREGWTSRTKEFVHNVARTNQPERLNLLSAVRGATGDFGPATVASVNFGYDGRPAAVSEVDGSALFFFHTLRAHGWDIWSKRYTPAGGWQASEPVVDRAGIDKRPAAARQGDTLWLFWESYDPDGDRRWHVNARTRTGGVWSPAEVFDDPEPERRLPAAVADGAGGVWLFWLERTAGAWQLRYNRHDGTRWHPGPPATLPLDGGQQPRVEDDVHVVFHPGRPSQPLWLFWARRAPGGPPGQTRWNVVYRIKPGLDPAATDWSPIRALPGTGADHDRYPSARPLGADLEVFWASTRAGAWQVFRATLATAALTWSGAVAVTTGPYTSSGPLAVPVGTGTVLAYRSNRSIEYASATYRATHTLDNRYGGTTTADTRATEKLRLRGTFEDFQTYIYDTGPNGRREEGDRVSRDTVGLYLDRGRGPAVTPDAVTQLEGVLADFVPAVARTVLITP